MAQRARVTTRIECPVDPVIAGVALCLLSFGLIMVASASTEVSARIYGNPFYLMIRHSAYVLLGTAAGIAVLMLPLRIWQKLELPLLLLSFVLLVAVLVPGIGKEVNGAARWISLGLFSVQGSELVKLFVVIYIAGYLVRRKQEVQEKFTGSLKPLLIVSLLAVLLIKQPDFGAAVVIMSAVMGVVYLAGAPMRYLLPVLSLFAGAAVLVATLQPYRLARFASFIDPWQHQFGGGYQLTQALIAFGRGEWFGLGLGNSIQKLFFLPEAHTDFLFSIIAEEMGVVGAAVIILLFACLVIRGLWIGRIAASQGAEFHAFLAYGISMLLGVQAAINLGVNLGLLPTKGLTFPLMSYGGNSLIVSCMLIAILLRIEYECRSYECRSYEGRSYEGRNKVASPLSRSRKRG
jgi:cell division protein FtsW